MHQEALNSRPLCEVSACAESNYFTRPSAHLPLSARKNAWMEKPSAEHKTFFYRKYPWGNLS